MIHVSSKPSATRSHAPWKSMILCRPEMHSLFDSKARQEATRGKYQGDEIKKCLYSYYMVVIISRVYKDLGATVT
jgi:hypothetical protein